MNLAVNLRKRAGQAQGQRVAGNFWQTVALDHDAAKDPQTIRQHLPKLQFFKTDEMPFWPFGHLPLTFFLAQREGPSCCFCVSSFQVLMVCKYVRMCPCEFGCRDCRGLLGRPYALGRYSFVTNWTACTRHLSIPGLTVQCHLPHSNFLKAQQQTA